MLESSTDGVLQGREVRGSRQPRFLSNLLDAAVLVISLVRLEHRVLKLVLLVWVSLELMR